MKRRKEARQCCEHGETGEDGPVHQPFATTPKHEGGLVEVL